MRLDAADLAAWRAFLASDRVQAFLLEQVGKCRELAERARRQRAAIAAPGGRPGSP